MPRHKAGARGAISDEDYRALAEFRYRIRKFLRFSEEAARTAGVEPQQHQLLLAVKASAAETSLTVGELAERLQIQHHSAVELVNRSEENGLIRRARKSNDRRVVQIELTPRGDRVLRDLTLHHREALTEAAPELAEALDKLLRTMKGSRGTGEITRRRARGNSEPDSSEAESQHPIEG